MPNRGGKPVQLSRGTSLSFNHGNEQKKIISIKFIGYYQVFLVAGGYDFSDLLSSTETLVEGGQAWNFQQPLPSGRDGLNGISLPNTVIMTGKKVPTSLLLLTAKLNWIYLY